MEPQIVRWPAGDGVPISARCWRPPGRTQRAVVCLVHGLGEHAGRYRHVAEALLAAGYALLAADLRGHGESAGRRGHAPSLGTLLDDIDLLLDQAGMRFPGRPRFLYGHSLGGNLVLNHALRRRPELAGVVATSPALGLDFEPPRTRLLLGRAANRLWPAYRQPHALDLKALSRDPDVIAAYHADPLIHGWISARLAMHALDAGRWALQQAAHFPLPLLLMHGRSDRLTSFELSRQFAVHANQRCTFVAWDEMYHELHNEPERGAVLETIVAWLDAVLGA